MPIVIYSFDEFCKQHGKPTNVRNRLLFPDGWQTDISDNWRQPPPAADFERLKLQQAYWGERHRRAVDDFNKLKNALLGRGEVFHWPMRDYGTDPGDGVAALQALKGFVEQFRGELVKIDALLAATPEVRQQRQAQAVSQQIAQQNQERQLSLAAEVEKINLDS